MTAEPNEKTQILLNQRIKFKSLKGKGIGLTVMPDPRFLGLATMLTQTT